MDKGMKQSLGAEDKQNSGSAAPEAVVSGASRRRFSRNALVGGAVVLSLGNRAAWGVPGNGNEDNCVSKNTLASFSTASLGPADEGKSTIEKVENFNNKLLEDDIEGVVKANGDHCAESCVPAERAKAPITEVEGINYDKHGNRLCGQYPPYPPAT